MTISSKLIATGLLVSLLALSGCAASGKTQAHNMMVKGNNLILVPVQQKEDENCQKPLQIKADVSTKILNSGRALTIPVRIAGQPHDMIVDTGAAFSVIHNNVANSVGASREKMKTIYMVDSAGVTINEVATVSMFEMGGLFKSNFDFFITPDTSYAQEYRQVTKTPLAGLFGMDVLSRYDLELNTAKGVFRLLSQDHCPGKVVHWTDEYTVIPLLKRAVVGPSYIGTFGHSPYVMVRLNGVEVLALLDTGAEESIIDIDFAEKTFGLKLDRERAPHTAIGVGASGKQFKTYAYVFNNMQMGGVLFNNPRINVAKIAGVDLVIGMHQLRMFHLYFAFGEGRLYLSHWDAKMPDKQPKSAENRSATQAASARQ